MIDVLHRRPWYLRFISRISWWSLSPASHSLHQCFQEISDKSEIRGCILRFTLHPNSLKFFKYFDRIAYFSAFQPTFPAVVVMLLSNYSSFIRALICGLTQIPSSILHTKSSERCAEIFDTFSIFVQSFNKLFLQAELDVKRGVTEFFRANRLTLSTF